MLEMNPQIMKIKEIWNRVMEKNISLHQNSIDTKYALWKFLIVAIKQSTKQRKKPLLDIGSKIT